MGSKVHCVDSAHHFSPAANVSKDPATICCQKSVTAEEAKSRPLTVEHFSKTNIHGKDFLQQIV